jgi:hypothetical protein
MEMDRQQTRQAKRGSSDVAAQATGHRPQATGHFTSASLGQDATVADGRCAGKSLAVTCGGGGRGRVHEDTLRASCSVAPCGITGGPSDTTRHVHVLPAMEWKQAPAVCAVRPTTRTRHGPSQRPLHSTSLYGTTL